MIGLAPLALSGSIAGALHVLSGPDHLSAIAPLAADSRRHPWKAGFQWGVGHTAGVLTVGLAALALRGLLPIDRLSAVSERIVGLALIAVGLWGLARALRTRLHVHEHAHDGSVHSHVHVHDAASHHQPSQPVPAARHGHDHVHASFLFGVLHGVAGSSHIFGVLPALALPTQSDSIAYLVAYGSGTVLAMTAFSSLIGLVASRARTRGTTIYRGLLYACSGAALLVGSAWLVI